MIGESIYTKNVCFEDAAQDFCRTNNQLANMYDEFMRIYGHLIGEIGIMAISKLTELTRQHEMAMYYIYRSNHTLDDAYSFNERMKKQQDEKILQQAA